MAERDEVERLRAADPVEPSEVPSAADPEARAMKEKIMTDQRIDRKVPARAALLAAAAVVVLVVGAVMFVGSRGGDVQVPGPGIQPPVQGSCVETYSLETLPNRELAFDGEVVSTSGDEVTFRVRESFKGAAAGELTLKGASTIGGTTSAGEGVSLAPGTRVLVAGEGGFAWGCGFTQPYDAGVAAQWRTALANG